MTIRIVKININSIKLKLPNS